VAPPAGIRPRDGGVPASSVVPASCPRS
jgi:hypothetical protein